MLFYCLMLLNGCMGTTVTEATAAEGQGQSWWIVLVYCYTIFVIISIPMFCTGVVSASNMISRLPAGSTESGRITKLKKRLIVFFILCICLPVVGIIFFILMLITRSKIMRMRSEINQQKLETIDTTASSARINQAEEIKHFKELLDSGAITQEEFDAKKGNIGLKIK